MADTCNSLTPTSPPPQRIHSVLRTYTDLCMEERLSEPTLVRYADFWFSDGSVVLKAENTLFRVHMSQLSRHSSFFHDLFSLPQPASTGSSHSDDQFLDGCPVVFLHDTAEDVTHLLKAIYDGPNFGNNDRDDFRVVSGVLRLASKYVIDKLRQRALAHLCIAWPSTLKAWDLREDIARSHEVENAAHRGHRYPSPIAIISLAREVDAPELLHSAFYDLSRYHYAHIFESSEDDPLDALAGVRKLSLDDMQKLMLGKEASQHMVTSLIQGMSMISERETQHLANRNCPPLQHHRRRSAGQVCMSPSACRKDFSELVDLATQHYLFDRERGCSDPLYVAEELGQLKSAEFSECKACAKALESWATRERERIWKLIPTWFRLEG